MGNKLPKILVTSKQKKEYYTKDAYLCTCDREHRMVHEFEGEGGEKFTLFLPKDKSNDHREKHPNIGKIAYAPEGSQFKEGDELLCRHFTFELDDNTPRVFYEHEGEEYYKVTNQDIMFGIRDGELIPREGVLLCEGIEDKLYDTTLELLASDIDVRRDVCKVVKVWDGCTEFKAGDYILLAKGGDYPFNHKGKDYLKVDHYFEDVIAVVGSPKWRRKEVLKRVKDHSKKHTPM